MKTKVLKLLGAVVFSFVGAGASIAAAADTGGYSGQYGAAPESLDYPGAEALKASSSDKSSASLSKKEVSALKRDELFFLSEEDPFPATKLLPIDPISRKKMDAMLIGPAFKTRGTGASFDYYRYVTFYDEKIKKEQFDAFPIIRRECHNDSDAINSLATNTVTYSITTSVTASASFEGLGLSGTVAQTNTLTTARPVNATKKYDGFVVDHIPYVEKTSWVGKTYIQILNSKTMKTGYLIKKRDKTPWYIDIFFPLLRSSEYPMNFEVKNKYWTLGEEIKVVKKCEN